MAEEDSHTGNAVLELQDEAQSPTMSVQEKVQDEDNTQDKNRGFIRTIGLVLYEQRARWPLYVAVLISTAGAGSKLISDAS